MIILLDMGELSRGDGAARDDPGKGVRLGRGAPMGWGRRRNSDGGETETVLRRRPLGLARREARECRAIAEEASILIGAGDPGIATLKLGELDLVANEGRNLQRRRLASIASHSLVDRRRAFALFSRKRPEPERGEGGGNGRGARPTSALLHLPRRRIRRDGETISADQSETTQMRRLLTSPPHRGLASEFPPCGRAA